MALFSDDLPIFLLLNKPYLPDSYIVFTLKMKSVPKIKFFGLKMMMKMFFEFLRAEDIFFQFILLTNFDENHKFSIKNNHLPAWRKIQNIFFPYVIDQIDLLVLSRFQSEGKTNV